jgi:hypothetical protein
MVNKIPWYLEIPIAYPLMHVVCSILPYYLASIMVGQKWAKKYKLYYIFYE